MNDSDTNAETQQSVVAIVKEDGVLKAVELRRHSGATEIVWAKSTDSADVSWQSFAAECGLAVGPATEQAAASDRKVVVGFGSAGTVFHRSSVPPVDAREIESIVRLQAETRLPLPAEQTELAWRADPMQNGQVGVTMVVARKELLSQFVQEVRPLDPVKIILDCEGIIKVWRTVFSEHERDGVVVSMAARSTQVCLARAGRLSNAVILDVGLEDFSSESPTDQTDTTESIALDMGLESFSAGKSEGQTEVAERFVQDMRSVMGLFGFDDPTQVPIFVLSDDSEIYRGIVSSLTSADLSARLVVPDARTLQSQGQSGVQWIYDYRAAIGLGLMGVEDGTQELNIFQNVYSRLEGKQKERWLYSPKVAAVIACVMLVALVVVTYVVDLKSPKSIMARVAAPTAEAKTDLDSLVQRQKLIRMVARERPDMLALLKLINDCGERGVLLNSVTFKKDQKVTITGQVQNSEQLYKFQENLDKDKNVTEVKIPNTGRITTRSGGGSSGRTPPGGPAPRPSGPEARPGGPASRPGGPPSAEGSRGGRGGITFTITFHYKNFTRKTARAQG
jgi:hypothetical protein